MRYWLLIALALWLAGCNVVCLSGGDRPNWVQWEACNVADLGVP